jgi:hypothetical protein
VGPLTSFEIVIGAPSASFVETGSVATAIGRHPFVFVDVAVGDVILVPGVRARATPRCPAGDRLSPAAAVTSVLPPCKSWQLP